MRPSVGDRQPSADSSPSRKVNYAVQKFFFSVINWMLLTKILLSKTCFLSPGMEWEWKTLHRAHFSLKSSDRLPLLTYKSFFVQRFTNTAYLLQMNFFLENKLSFCFGLVTFLAQLELLWAFNQPTLTSYFWISCIFWWWATYIERASHMLQKISLCLKEEKRAQHACNIDQWAT